jgi:Cu(I)/Ag(I) efflux system membrane protein CusA/SilA
VSRWSPSTTVEIAKRIDIHKSYTVLIFPTVYAMTGGLILQWLFKYTFSVAVGGRHIALFGIAVDTGVVMVVYLQETRD